MTGGDPITLALQSPQESEQFGADLAMAIPAGGMIHLEGDLGSGKSTIARALIRHLAGDNKLEVPSPTFALVHDYPMPTGCLVEQVLHADLYRVRQSGEIGELGIADPDPSTLTLVEWPQNAGGMLPGPSLLISIRDADRGRTLQISGDEDWVQRLERSLAIRKFLDRAWGKAVVRHRLTGDASSRAYETAKLGDACRIVMNAPRQPDGPVIRDGIPYSQIAHLAEDVSAFVGVAGILRSKGIRTPKIHYQSPEEGLLLIEDLGSGKIIDAGGRAIKERYLASVEMLARFHSDNSNQNTNPARESAYTVPEYDRGAMMIEAELLLDWYAPRFKNGNVTPSEKAAFIEIWNALIDQLGTSEKQIVLRDFHSPNIIWQESERGHDQVAVIDFQDAVFGPAAYDVASLAQDARVDIDPKLEGAIVSAYLEGRAGDTGFDVERFKADYAIMAAQRATKILGIFVRLDERDGKPAYLKNLPRIQSYLRRSLTHQALAAYRKWCETVIGL
jgi:tRNA threonylcarbamoyl adenosine modification protein YjeE